MCSIRLVAQYRPIDLTAYHGSVLSKREAERARAILGQRSDVDAGRQHQAARCPRGSLFSLLGDDAAARRAGFAEMRAAARVARRCTRCAGRGQPERIAAGRDLLGLGRIAGQRQHACPAKADEIGIVARCASRSRRVLPSRTRSASACGSPRLPRRSRFTHESRGWPPCRSSRLHPVQRLLRPPPRRCARRIPRRRDRPGRWRRSCGSR